MRARLGCDGPYRGPHPGRIFIHCRGHGSPTVLLESGLRNRGDIWEVTDGPAQTPVLPRLARTTRVCDYDRPGTTLGADDPSRSDPAPMPRTSR